MISLLMPPVDMQRHAVGCQQDVAAQSAAHRSGNSPLRD